MQEGLPQRTGAKTAHADTSEAGARVSGVQPPMHQREHAPATHVHTHRRETARVFGVRDGVPHEAPAEEAPGDPRETSGGSGRQAARQTDVRAVRPQLLRQTGAQETRTTTHRGQALRVPVLPQGVPNTWRTRDT